MRVTRSLSLLALAALALSAAAQNTWYVDASSMAFPLGTQSNPFTQLTQASAVCQAGDMVVVAPGSYGAVTFFVPAQLSSTGGRAVTSILHLDGMGDPTGFTISLLTSPVGVVASDCSIGQLVSAPGFMASGCDIGTLTLNSQGEVHFDDCDFQLPTAGSCFVIGPYTLASFDRCRFVVGPSNPSNFMYAFEVRGTCVLDNCVVQSSATTFARVVSFGIMRISSSTFVNINSPNAIQLNASSNFLMENSILWNSGGIQLLGTPNFFAVDHCDVPNAALYGNGCFTADPIFIDAAMGDFHLAPGSPCINAGTNMPLFLPMTDFEGDMRIRNGTIDIGADEADATLTVLGPCGNGNVGVGQGGPFGVLKINGSTGGLFHRVDVATIAGITISVDQPPTNPFPAPFILYGLIGTPQLADVTLLPSSIGSMCFPPPPLLPGFPLLFTFANSVSFDPSAITGATPAPWSATDANGLPFPFQLTFQGVIFQDPGTVRVTNGVILNVQ